MSYLKILFRRKELLIIATFTGLVLGICASVLLPKEYQSSTVILVQEGKSDNPMFDKLAVSTNVAQRMSGIKESILGWNSMVELVKRLDLAKDVKTKLGFEQLIETLRRSIMIRLRGQNILHLSYIGKDPEKTQAIVKNVTDIFVEKNVQMQSQETSDAITFIQEQLHVYKGKIKSAQIAEIQDLLNGLLKDSTEKHPLVKRYREQIDSMKADLKKENLEYSEEIGALTPQTTNPLIDQIKKALDNIEGNSAAQPSSETDIYKAMLMANLDNVAARDIKVNESIYNTLLQRLETAKITQRLQASKEGTRYTVLDPPRIPLKPIKPNKILVSFMGLFFGIMVGVGLIFGAEFMDKSFIDVEEAKEYLGVPLLGAISKINTEETIAREKDREKWMYTMTFAGGIAVLVIAIVVSLILK
jgi:uncharacterized protein involved in exopolysaccharide biosynthesis